MKYSFNETEHLHLLDDVALTGTSSIGNVLVKNLVWWAAELSAVECLESGEKIPTIREEYENAAKSPNKKIAIDALQEKYPIFKKARFAHFKSRNKSAKKGTDLHAELEKYVKDCIRKGACLDAEYDKKIYPFIRWAEKNVKRFIASEAHCFSSRLFVGGIIDAVAELNDGSYATIDFKSSKDAYPTAFLQTAGYSIQIEENGLWDKTGTHHIKLDKKIEKLIVVAFGAEQIVPQVRTEVTEYKNGFEHAVALYRLLGLDKKQKQYGTK